MTEQAVTEQAVTDEATTADRQRKPPRPGGRRAPRSHSLLLRLLVAYLLPTLVLLGLFGLLARRVAERSLEQSLGRRLTGVAQATAPQLRPEAVSFLAPGDDDSRTARRLRHKLRAIRDQTRVGRIFILDRELRSRVDTKPGVRIGDRYYHAEPDRSELERVFAGGEASSVLFTGDDGRFHKAGYAPLRQRGGRVIAAIGVEGSAEYFRALEELSAYLLLSGAGIAVLVIIISLLLARRITRPLGALADEATRIGAGDLERPVPVPRGRDEVGLLASTMNEMRQALYERDQELQMMLSGIAHEVRNPLGGIALFAGLLREEVADDPDQLEMVERIERELTYLKNVVGEFLDFARRSPPALRPLDLGSLLADAAQLLAADATKAEVTLEVEPPGAPVSVLGDAEQLRRVVLNLTRNALQATPAGGRVSLRTAPSDDGCLAWFEVEDSGAGIPEQIRDKVFAPFFTTREKGTGLGLALSRKVTSEHGGEIELHSGPTGTRIRVILLATSQTAPHCR